MGNAQLFDQLINSGGCYLTNVAPIVDQTRIRASKPSHSVRMLSGPH